MKVPAPHYLLYAQARPDAVRSGSGRWRFVLESADGGSHFEAADEEVASPQRLELLAIVRGLEALDQPSHVTLVTGSRYVSRGIRFGLAQWREDGWQWERYGEMSPVKDHDLWKRVDQALQFHDVECRAADPTDPDDLVAPPLRLLEPTEVRVNSSRRRHRGKSLRFDGGEGPHRGKRTKPPATWRSGLGSWFRRLWRLPRFAKSG